MEFRKDLLFSVAQYSNDQRGLLTLGEFKKIELPDGRQIELMPYLIETHTTRGVSKKDPRRRMYRNNAIPQLAGAYAEHYNNANLGEHWTKEEVIRMLEWQMGQSNNELFMIKWAKEVGTENEFPIGFFCAYAKPYNGGSILWDGELFVLPEYRRYGIGTELTEALFTKAMSMGIDVLEALTYEDNNGYPLKFWQKIGANTSDLIHIYGNINEMLSNLEEEKENHKSL